MTATGDFEERIGAIRAMLDRNEQDVALDMAEAVVEEYPDRSGAWGAMGNVLKNLGDMFRAAQAYDRAVALGDPMPSLYLGAAYCWMITGQSDVGLNRLDQCERLHGISRDTAIARGELLERARRLDEAQAAIERSLDGSSGSLRSEFLRAKIDMGRTVFGAAADRLTRMVESDSDDLETVRLAWFQLAKIHDKHGDYDQAWESATRAHHVGHRPSGASAPALMINNAISNLSEELLEACARASTTSEQGIFIVGTPRSGTSLLEQILSMHPDVACAGESAAGHLLLSRLNRELDSYNAYPRNLIDLRASDADRLQAMYLEATSWIAPEATRITNKCLTMPIDLPLLSLVMPGSRAILLRRHPLDNAVSCYTTPLHVGNQHQWTATIEGIGLTQLAFHRAIDWYAQHLPLETLSLDYEDLVNDQEAQTKAMIGFFGLDWDPSCLEFHKSTRVAQTISYDQVNRKMYRSSQGRWKNYEKHLGPLIDQLEPLLEGYGG